MRDIVSNKTRGLKGWKGGEKGVRVGEKGVERIRGELYYQPKHT